ncbi:hypothetical protein C8R44DRAFT_885634 [Mycena epipterygia]|nr:hypothetical protein C8R44DRAFT_885634 [Mycena epipterygia]
MTTPAHLAQRRRPPIRASSKRPRSSDGADPPHPSACARLHPKQSSKSSLVTIEELAAAWSSSDQRGGADERGSGGMEGSGGRDGTRCLRIHWWVRARRMGEEAARGVQAMRDVETTGTRRGRCAGLADALIGDDAGRCGQRDELRRPGTGTQAGTRARAGRECPGSRAGVLGIVLVLSAQHVSLATLCWMGRM